MDNPFEPSFKPQSDPVFHEWESRTESVPQEPVIDEQEILRQTCEKLKEEAKVQGYAEGLKAAEAKLKKCQKEFSHALNALLQPQQSLNETVIKELVLAIIWICKTCIDIELTIHPEKLTSLFTVIKEELPSLKGNKKLALHPQDLEWVRTQTHEDIYGEIQNMLVADPGMTRGGFYLESDQSILDGQIISRLTNLFSEHVSKADFMSTAIRAKDA